MRFLFWIVVFFKIVFVSGDFNRIFGGVIVWRWFGNKVNIKEND